MSKRGNETYLEYKQRIIDPVSSSFCAAKWYSATIWLGSGKTTSCHHPPAQEIPVELLFENPSAIHNTPHKKKMRKMMLEGIRPQECEFCWLMEDANPNVVSDRAFKTSIYSDEEVKALSEIYWDENVDLKRLEIAFDRICNFACSYCNATFSTTWAKDIKTNGKYPNLVSDGRSCYEQDGSWAEPYGKNNEGNPYIAALWQWWPKLSKTLQELRITGGEPTMSPHFWELMERIKETGLNEDILFSINTNLGMKDDILNRLIQSTSYVKNFDVYTSNEAYGVQAEYIRDGLNYDQWYQNLRRIAKEGEVRTTHVMMTIPAICLFSITDMLDDLLEMKRELGPLHPHLSVNMVQFPSFMCPLVFPDYIKQERRDHLIKWYKETMEDEPLFREVDREGIRTLIGYLKDMKTPHSRTSSLESQQADFYTFYTEYDKRRGKNFRETFPPILVDWFDELGRNIEELRTHG